MVAIAESSEANADSPSPSPSPSLPADRVKHEDKSDTVGQGLGEFVPWIDNAVQQAQLAQKTVENTLENAIVVTKSRLDRLLTTSSVHFNQTLVSSSYYRFICLLYASSALEIIFPTASVCLCIFF